jgi:hypothetical protein
VTSNVWSSASNPLYDSMIRTYQDVFDELYVLRISGAGNRIFIAPRQVRRFSRQQLSQRARSVSRAKEFRYDLGRLVTFGYQYAQESPADGEVLKDGQQSRQAG